jgi:ppGpp synthetase/RelA/SpoT-type nucleotidyltranferase
MGKVEVGYLISAYKKKRPMVRAWMQNVVNILENDHVIVEVARPLIIKSRVKDDRSFAIKARNRHDPETRPISAANFIAEITDLSGVRLVLAQKQDVALACSRIRELAEEGNWMILETENYVWHPDEVKQVRSTGEEAKTKETSYCSRHFILVRRDDATDEEVRPRCELQVRTILEEAIWENDKRLRHKKRYAKHTGIVLSRLAQFLETADQLLVDIYNLAKEEVK